MKNQSISSNYSEFKNEEGEELQDKFTITYTTINGASFIINVIAVIIIFKKKVLKPLEIIVLNISFLNVIYALDQLVRTLINVTEQYHGLFENEKAELFYNISGFSSPIIVHSICFFIVFLTLQRAMAIMHPLKYNKYVTNSNTYTGAAVLHILAIILFITCTLLVFKSIVDGEKLLMVLNCLFVIESVLIIMCYIMILYKIKTCKSMSVIVKSSKRPLKMAVIVSASFLISYIPIGFVFILQQKESILFETALVMLWIDSFVNPLVIIFDTYSMRRQRKILRSIHEWMNSIFSKRKPHIAPCNEDHTSITNISL